MPAESADSVAHMDPQKEATVAISVPYGTRQTYMPRSLALRGDMCGGTCTQERSKSVSNIRGPAQQWGWEKTLVMLAASVPMSDEGEVCGGVVRAARTMV